MFRQPFRMVTLFFRFTLFFVLSTMCVTTGYMSAFGADEREGKALSTAFYDDVILYEKLTRIEGTDLFKYGIRTMEKGFLSKRGIVGAPIRAESGERIELWWTGVFPRYELYFYPKDPEEKGRRIGKCHFLRGCNRSHFIAPDGNDNGIPDVFVLIVWESTEGCSGESPDGPRGYFKYTYLPEYDHLLLVKGQKEDIVGNSFLSKNR
ncbi:MAG: hypothetical protein N2745_02520 [Syntrophorhabdaceae bacterium]|nr:hypothetical protein [Syntrophorhabdaceae bacterium]